jgi:redox-sensitive bicupin YhaK (pirin superfamily)
VSRADTDVAIATVRLEAGATITLPPARDTRTMRLLYFFAGPSMRVGERALSSHAAAVVRGDLPARLEAGPGECELLLLQGRPIGQPVVQYGPFVMNTQAEIQKAMADYRRTGFGGWPWPKDDPVHPADAGRFAKHADGRVEQGPR